MNCGEICMNSSAELCEILLFISEDKSTVFGGSSIRLQLEVVEKKSLKRETI
jgi:hypothetical protein